MIYIELVAYFGKGRSKGKKGKKEKRCKREEKEEKKAIEKKRVNIGRGVIVLSDEFQM